MGGEMTPLDGEQKKRVVCNFSFLLSMLSDYSRHELICTSSQCYFFDSDVSGFHYGPGHP